MAVDAQLQSPELALIQTVRSLDSTGPGPAGEHLVTLWRRLISNSASQFHAAEQSALRWLLKVMSPAKPSPAAELVQRFPTTWRILACIFERVPLFSLAKALADRRFVAVLRQTLERVSGSGSGQAAAATAASLGKRKRANEPGFDLDALRNNEGSLATADALFDALRRLVERMRSGRKEGGHAKMGAEHVKSLFCLPAADALAIVGPLLMLCQRRLAAGPSTADDRDEPAASWMGTACAVWDLHLQGQGDAVEVATHLARTACVVLRELAESAEYGWAIKWSGELERFVRDNVVLPSRAEFLVYKATSILDTAMGLAGAQADVVGTTLYELAVDVYHRLGGTSAGDDEWIRTVFRVVEEHLEGLQGPEKRASAVLRMLMSASDLHSAIGHEDLQAACRRYGLQEDDSETDWAILKAAAELDPTLFFVGQGEALLEAVCERLLAVRRDTSPQFEQSAAGLALAVVRGFATARNLQAFLKRWYGELAKAGDEIEQSVWFSDAMRSSADSPLVADLEAKLSPQQVLAFVDWLAEQEGSPLAQITVLATITEGLSSEQFVDAIGTKACDMVEPHLQEGRVPINTIVALGWRVVSRTISWSTSVETTPIWKRVKKQLARVLKKSPPTDVLATEAFRCVSHFWASLYPDADSLEEVHTEAVSFIKRIDKSRARTDEPASMVTWQTWREGRGRMQHSPASNIAWSLYGPARVVEMLPHEHGKLPAMVERRLKHNTADADSLIEGLLENQALLDDGAFMRPLIDHVVSLLITRRDAEKVLAMMLRIPVETFTREQRRTIMGELVGRATKSPADGLDANSWKVALGLMIWLMRDRPTFYDDIKFQDLVALADCLGAISAAGSDEDADVLSTLYAQFATIMVQQTATNLDEAKSEYFSDAAQFVRDETTADRFSSSTQFIRLRLLSALFSAPASNLSKFPTETRDALHVDSITAAISRGLVQYAGLEGEKSKKKNASAKQMHVKALFVAMDAASSPSLTFSPAFKDTFPARVLEKHANKQLDAGDRRGWRIKAFLIANFPDQIKDRRPTQYGHESTPSAGLPEALPGRKWRACIGAAVDATLSSLGREDQFSYAREILAALDTATPGPGRRRQLFAFHRALESLVGLPDGPVDRFSFASLHSDLVSRLCGMADEPELRKTLALVLVLLDKKSGFMAQWNIECTLAAVSVIATTSHHAIVLFPQLCKLVETLIRRHRVRLEGHYHIITTTLQCLLRAFLLVGPAGGGGSPSEAHAHMFARLVTMLCIPTAGAVGRNHHKGQRPGDIVLDSATASAKRFAGQYMYVVLMAYIKIILDEDGAGAGSSTKAVTDALEPGWTALFDVTPPDTRRILNDALDEGGREVVREMWKRYSMFGKWTGV